MGIVARRRGLALFVSVCVLVAIAILLVGGQFIRLSPRADWSVSFALIATVIPVCFISIAVLPRRTSAERQRSRSLLLQEFITVVFCLTSSVVVLTGAVLLTSGLPTAAAAMRNAVGLLGLAIVGGAVFGPRFGWLLPTAFVFMPAVLSPDPTRLGPSSVSFVFRDASDTTALWSALLYLALGFVAIVVTCMSATIRTPKTSERHSP